MLKNIATVKPEVNAQLEKVEIAATAIKKAAGELNWVLALEIEVSEGGVIRVGNGPAETGRKVIEQMGKACSEYETAVEELRKLQA